MSLFKTYTLNVIRPTATATEGQYVNGRWVPGNTAINEFPIQTSVQPANGKDLQTLPEGLRTKDTIKMYPDTPVNNVDQHILQESDIIEYNGKQYTVIFVGDWQNNLISHYKVMANRVKEKVAS